MRYGFIGRVLCHFFYYRLPGVLIDLHDPLINVVLGPPIYIKLC